ncbi:MAG: LysR family transcriptional regulator [Hyphomonas sp.]|nr:LysR family transcriptional regulator [Hyphomonas sp.]
MNIAAVDLNLLKAFDALYRERHVTRAGQSIGLAQPTMSNALSRLRYLFDDKLFARSPRGMLPTERAHALAPKIAQALALVSEVVEPAAAFDPKTAKAEITIAAPDSVVMTIGADLATSFAATAPNFDLRFRPLAKATLFDELDTALVDCAIGTFADIPARFYQRTAKTDGFVCIARKNHPMLKDGLTLERFTELSHVLATLKGDAVGVMDDRLKDLGLTRRIALTVGQVTVVPDIVANTDYIATIPSSVGHSIADRAGCDVFPVPLDFPDWTVSLIWSEATQANVAKRFAVSQIEVRASGSA